MDYQDWTSCEMHGHDYKPSETRVGVLVCGDCQDEYEEGP